MALETNLPQRGKSNEILSLQHLSHKGVWFLNNPSGLLGYQSLVEVTQEPKPHTTLLLRKANTVPANPIDLRLSLFMTPPKPTNHSFHLPIEGLGNRLGNCFDQHLLAPNREQITSPTLELLLYFLPNNIESASFILTNKSGQTQILSMT